MLVAVTQKQAGIGRAGFRSTGKPLHSHWQVCWNTICSLQINHTDFLCTFRFGFAFFVPCLAKVVQRLFSVHGNYHPVKVAFPQRIISEFLIQFGGFSRPIYCLIHVLFQSGRAAGIHEGK